MRIKLEHFESTQHIKNSFSIDQFTGKIFLSEMFVMKIKRNYLKETLKIR